jgi:hypothetical protein
MTLPTNIGHGEDVVATGPHRPPHMLDLAVRNIVAKAVSELLGFEGSSAAELLAARLPEMLLRLTRSVPSLG